MSRNKLTDFTEKELAEAILKEERRFHELRQRQAHPEAFPNHDVSGEEKLELKEQQAVLATLYSEQKRRQSP